MVGERVPMNPGRVARQNDERWEDKGREKGLIVRWSGYQDEFFDLEDLLALEEDQRQCNIKEPRWLLLEFPLTSTPRGGWSINWRTLWGIPTSYFHFCNDQLLGRQGSYVTASATTASLLSRRRACASYRFCWSWFSNYLRSLRRGRSYHSMSHLRDKLLSRAWSCHQPKLFQFILNFHKVLNHL